MDDALKVVEGRINDLLGDLALSSKIAYGQLTINVVREQIVAAVTKLRDDDGCRFEVLIDICGVDYPGRECRFDVVYHLLSVRGNLRLRIKLETDETTPVPSVVEIFPAANWFERE